MFREPSLEERLQPAIVLHAVGEGVADDADVVVAPALNFLYLVGRLEYHPINDTFEYQHDVGG